MPASSRQFAILAVYTVLITVPAVVDNSGFSVPAPAFAAAATDAARAPASGQHTVAAPHRPSSAKGRTAAADAASASAVPAPSSANATSPTNSTVKPGGSGKQAEKKTAATNPNTNTTKATKQSNNAAKAKTAKRGAKSNGPAVQNIKARRSPGWVTEGHYIRSLRGGHRDVGSMRALGMRDAARNPSGTQHLVLMDIGGQVPNGVHLSTMKRFVSYRSLVVAMNAYVDGYHARMRSNAPVTIAIGTNNDLSVTTGTGIAWARQVVNPIRSHASHYSQITVAGANDIEPGFRASPAETRAWLNGYLASTTAPFVFNGSADGCSWTRPLSHCNAGWTSRDLINFAGAIAPSRTIVLPQIYNNAMVGQWAQLARGATRSNHRLHIVGTLTENLACGRDPYCPTMPSWQAYRHLYAALRRVHQAPASMPYQVDLDVR